MGQREVEPCGGDGVGLAEFKDCLSDLRLRIRLDDQVSASVRAMLAETLPDKFPLNTPQVTEADVVARVAAYEAAVRPLLERAALLGSWATSEHLPTLRKLLARLADGHDAAQGGQVLWADLRFYPLSLLLYSLGIAALDAENYSTFGVAHTKPWYGHPRRRGGRGGSLVLSVVGAMQSLADQNAWRCLHEEKRIRAPESEHMYKVLRPILDKAIFIGYDYDFFFDRYEVLRTLIYSDAIGRARGPVGRFGWKYCGDMENNPYTDLRTEAAQQKDEWGPIKAGLFSGSYPRFEETAAKFQAEILDRLGWH